MNAKNNIAKSAALITLMMLAFKILGFVKQAVIAYVFGATVETDIYFIAWGFITGVSEAIVKALLVSLVAIYTSIRIRKGQEIACKLINALLEILFPVFMLLVTILYFCAPLFSRVLAPTYDGESLKTLAFFIQILSPILLFGCFELVFGAIEDSFKEFMIPRLQSLIYSLCVIFACFALSSRFGIYALVFAQFASSIVFIIMLLFAIKKHHHFFIVNPWQLPEVKEVLFTAIPLFIGNSALQINQIVDKSITSGLGAGTASALSYCHTLEQFVTNIMIVNIGNVMFANFAEFVAKEEYDNVKSVLYRAIDTLVIILGYISIIVFFCAEDIVSIVYYRGSFSYEAVRLTAIALIGYSVSFISVAIRDLSVKSLYAFKDTRRPMNASIISICSNIVLSILLSKYIGILGIALATSISAIIGAIINGISLKKHLLGYRYSKHIITLIKCIPGLCAVALACFMINGLFDFGYFSNFALCSCIGFLVYIVVLYLCRVEEVKIIGVIIRNKMGIKRLKR